MGGVRTPNVAGMTVLIADARVADIRVYDNGDPLVDLVAQGIACAGGSADLHSGHWVRAGVAERLTTADAALPPGIRLLVFEGLRSARAQRAIHASYSQQLRTARPELDEDEILSLASRYVAPLEVAPHVAGAAVDLTLVGSTGNQLPMGTRVDATPEESDNAIAFDADNISVEARANRGLLAEVLIGAGLANYPTEWWHWSYGDRYWAYLTGAPRACYGPVWW